MKFHLPLGLLKVLLAVVCLPATTIAAALTDVTIGSSGEKITSDMVSINGVKLSDGLASGITADFTDNKDGAFTVSIGDGSVGIPQWDERWGKGENDPDYSRIYAGTDADNVELAAGIEGNTNYYRYSSIDEENAAKVNNGKAIVVTLSEGAEATLVAGSRIDENDVIAYDHEVWIEDRSKFENIIGGVDNSSGKWSDTIQTAATHILVNSNFKKRPRQCRSRQS